MGGISQLFDFNQANTSRKFFAHKRHNDGLEAPRNSLEFPVEASHNHHLIHGDNLYSRQVKKQSMKMNICPSETPLKMLINEELSNRSNKRPNAPGVVARLMGMDTLPSGIKPIVQAKESKDVRIKGNILRMETTEISSAQHKSLNSASINQAKQELLANVIKRDFNPQTKNLRSTKPQPREHPQEELLQKFKKEFEAWQASKVWERSITLELDNNIRQVKDNKILAQENLNKEKLARYADAKRNSARVEPRDFVLTAEPEILTWQGGDLQNDGYTSKHSQFNSKDDIALRRKAKTKDLVHLPVAKFDKSLDRSSPTRIVILKPSSEDGNDIEEPLVDSSKIPNKEGTMKDFLEEVKERLRYEIQGKATVGEIGTETSFSERSTDPKQIARHIAKQIRESVTRDLGTTLVRSESTRSYRSEFQFNESGSPEFISRYTRKLLSERLKNVLKNESKVDIPLINNGRSRASIFPKEDVRLRPMFDFSEMGKKVSYKEDKKGMTESKIRSFRHKEQNSVLVEPEAVSPRNLVRSFSAPVSGTAFGKLLLEDQHVLTGAHIRRKHEASEYSSAEARKNRKNGFNLKDRVSSLRHNFSLKSKLFKKKIQSVPELASNEFDPMRAIVTTPSVVMKLRIVQDNFTEVPPSPASVSNISYGDFCRPGHPSPDSPLEAPFIEYHSSSQASGELISNFPASFTEYHSSSQASRELISNFPESMSLSEHVESGGSAEVMKSMSEHVESGGIEATVEGEPYEDETMNLEAYTEAYARRILVTAGLYEGLAFDQAFSRLDALARPISKCVFEKVEEAYRKNGAMDEVSQCCSDTGLSRKMIFDLINEILPRLLGPPAISSTFKKWFLSPETKPHGRQLLNDSMHQIRIYRDWQVEEDGSHSLDSMVACDLKIAPWPSTSHEDIEIMGRALERVILRELIDEFVLDICSSCHIE